MTLGCLLETHKWPPDEVNEQIWKWWNPVDVDLHNWNGLVDPVDVDLHNWNGLVDPVDVDLHNWNGLVDPVDVDLHNWNGLVDPVDVDLHNWNGLVDPVDVDLHNWNGLVDPVDVDLHNWNGLVDPVDVDLHNWNGLVDPVDVDLHNWNGLVDPVDVDLHNWNGLVDPVGVDLHNWNGLFGKFDELQTAHWWSRDDENQGQVQSLSAEGIQARVRLNISTAHKCETSQDPFPTARCRTFTCSGSKIIQQLKKKTYWEVQIEIQTWHLRWQNLPNTFENLQDQKGIERNANLGRAEGKLCSKRHLT